MSDEYERFLIALEDELPSEVSLLCRAVQENDENTVRLAVGSLPKNLTISPKKRAIECDKPHLLRILMEENPSMDQSLMERACVNKNREIVDILLAYGWDINKPLSPVGGPLWSVRRRK
jgi:hypothetical protein